MSEPVLRVRSMLFVPGTRPDMIAKLPRFAPDVAVVDLEDAVSAADKVAARATAVEAVAALPETHMTTLIRVNPIGSTWFDDDIAAFLGSRADGIVVPKIETTDELDQLCESLRARRDAVIIVGFETARGVADARTLLGTVSACYFGAEDYIADIGGRRTAVGQEVLYARSQVVLAARLAGKPAIDQAVVNIADHEQFGTDARAGAELGYQGKICIHPSQVALAHAVFMPTEREVAHARAVVAAAASGVGVIDGQMVDEVHVRMARTTLSRAEGLEQITE